MFPVMAFAQAQRVGGPCTYASHPGTFTIIHVEKVNPANSSSRPPYQPSQVLFTFTPEHGAPELAPLLGKSHRLLLTNGADPGPKFLSRYAIRQGARFTGEARLIRSGTCTPWAFQMNGIDTSDLFEFNSR